jgi:hypothetical protein
LASKVTYKTLDPARQATSARFQDGREDGLEDAITASQCPPGYPTGYRPEYEFSWMYREGYDRTFQPMPCPCDRSCEAGKQYSEAPGGKRSTGDE